MWTSSGTRIIASKKPAPSTIAKYSEAARRDVNIVQLDPGSCDPAWRDREWPICLATSGRKGSNGVASAMLIMFPKFALVVIEMYLSVFAHVRRPSSTPVRRTSRSRFKRMMSALSRGIQQGICLTGPRLCGVTVAVPRRGSVDGVAAYRESEAHRGPASQSSHESLAHVRSHSAGAAGSRRNAVRHRWIRIGSESGTHSWFPIQFPIPNYNRELVHSAHPAAHATRSAAG